MTFKTKTISIKQPASGFKVDTKTKVHCKQTLKKTGAGGTNAYVLMNCWHYFQATSVLSYSTNLFLFYNFSNLNGHKSSAITRLFHLFSVFTALFIKPLHSENGLMNLDECTLTVHFL